MSHNFLNIVVLNTDLFYWNEFVFIYYV